MRIGIFVGFAFSVLVVASARADGTLNLQLGVPGDPTVWVNGEDVYSGPYQYYLTPSAGSTSLPSPFSTLSMTESRATVYGYCVDFITNIDTVTTYPANVENLGAAGSLHVSSSNLATATSELEELMTEFVNSGGSLSVTTGPTGGTQGKLQEALQLAMWEVVTVSNSSSRINENGSGYWLGSQSGYLLVMSASKSSDPGAIANYWLDNMAKTQLAPGLNFYSIVPTDADNSQIQSVVFGGLSQSDMQPVPEPGGLVGLAGLALCGLPLGARAARRGFVSARRLARGIAGRPSALGNH
jgi:hypothetical protein